MDINAASGGQITIGKDVTVNRMGFGAMRITGQGIWGEPDDLDSAKAVLKRAVELGVNFIDTADAYGPEVSENIIKDALYPYEGLIIATKGGMTRSGPGQWQADCSPDHLREALEGSLKRLNVQAIDLYQLHTVDAEVPFEDSLKTLIEMKQAGKIKRIGLSNIKLEHLEKALSMTDIASVQNRYNVTSDYGSESVLKYCQDKGIAFIPYFPVGGDGADMSALQSIADKHEASTHQVALAWLLAHSPVMLPIPGTSSITHLEQNVAAASLKLDDEDISQLNSIHQLA